MPRRSANRVTEREARGNYHHAKGLAWGQVVFAPLMMSLIFSAGVCPFKTRRGRRLRRSWTAWTWASVTSVKLVPLGKYSRISPPVFSLVGR